MAKEKAPAPAAAVPVVAPPKKKSKLLMIIIALLLVGGGGAGGAFYFSRQHPAEAKAVEHKPPVYVTLEPFTVNLLEQGGEHYLQAGIVYQVADAHAADSLKQYLPAIRNRVLLLLSSKHPSDLAGPEGKQQLVAEVLIAARESVPGETPERGIGGAYLSSFVIQ